MPEKIRVSLDLVLPSVISEQDRCIQRLIDLVQAKEGIDKVHLSALDESAQNQVCVHYDPSQISLGEVLEFVKRAGAELDAKYGHLSIRTNTFHARQVRQVEARLRNLPGIVDASVSPAGFLQMEFDRELVTSESLELELARIGLHQDRSSPDLAVFNEGTTSTEHGEHDHDHDGLFGENTELVFAIVSGGLLLLGWLLSFTSLSAWWATAFYAGACLFGGFFTVREAVENLRGGRFEIDTLMLAAAIGAISLGKWFEAALLLFLFSIGHALEHYAMGRAKRAIESLATLAPKTAQVRKNNQIQEVPVESVVLGDVVIVKPNERIPADGFVLKGSSSVNQAPITGESVPVDKQPVADLALATRRPEQVDAQSRIFAGTINGSGSLEIQVTRLATDSVLARVVRMVNESETQKSPTQRFTDRFERYFVPIAISLSVLLLFSWVVIDEPFSASFYRAMAVLVASSPCALAIATPSAVLSGIARAAQGGVLVKGGGPLENLGRLNAIAFDKTGTLTEGKPRLTDVVALAGIAEEELLRIAVAVERQSDHPLAAAVVRGSADRLKGSQIPEATDVHGIVGRGVRAKVEGTLVYLGKDSLFNELEGISLSDEVREINLRLKGGGRTTMIIRAGDAYLGVLGLMDTPRQSAREVISQLEQLGITRTIMLSGDNQQVANAVAKEVGITQAFGDLMPEDKVRAVKKLNQQEGVAMVGDGVNDAPAMANATVGIAMGAAGSDVALETADVALMADDLAHLPFAIGLSRQTSRIIQQNLWFSLGMVAFLIPATILGLQIGAAVVFHEGSTLLVVFNALRLLAYPKP